MHSRREPLTALKRAASSRIASRYYGTNNPNPLRLAYDKDLCKYTARDGSSISLLLSTLLTDKPTLAALAYYAASPCTERSSEFAVARGEPKSAAHYARNVT